MVRSLAITIKGTLTNKLYTVKDYEELRGYLPPNVQFSPYRYELDGKQRLHIHCVCEYTGKLPYFTHYFGKGWHVHSSPDPSSKWFSYIQKDGDVGPLHLEYKQALHAWRSSPNQFLLNNL